MSKKECGTRNYAQYPEMGRNGTEGQKMNACVALSLWCLAETDATTALQFKRKKKRKATGN